jgi:hypothetical protein
VRHTVQPFVNFLEHTLASSLHALRDTILAAIRRFKHCKRLILGHHIDVVLVTANEVDIAIEDLGGRRHCREEILLFSARKKRRGCGSVARLTRQQNERILDY